MRSTQITIGIGDGRRHRTGREFGWLPALLKAVTYRFELWRQRRALSQLDDRLLNDIGLKRSDVRRELEKPFWRI